MGYDHQEQEQLDAMKAWWNQYGNLILSLVTVILLAFAAYNGWQWYERSQTGQASLLYEELERSIVAKDNARVDRASTDLIDKYARTPYAAMGGVRAAKELYDAGDRVRAKAKLQWVSEQAKDSAYQLMAKLRLATVLMEDKAYDEALKVLATEPPAEYAALFADRQGDVYLLQNNQAAARQAYESALKKIAQQDNSLNEQGNAYAKTIELKLQLLNVPLDLSADLSQLIQPQVQPQLPEATVNPAATPASAQ